MPSPSDDTVARAKLHDGWDMELKTVEDIFKEK